MIFMNNKAELQKIQLVIESKQVEKEKYEKKLVQLKNREKKLKRQVSIEERKIRTHRLIERGAILESFILNVQDYSNQKIKNILQELFQKAD